MYKHKHRGGREGEGGGQGDGVVVQPVQPRIQKQENRHRTRYALQIFVAGSVLQEVIFTLHFISWGEEVLQCQQKKKGLQFLFVFFNRPQQTNLQ